MLKINKFINMNNINYPSIFTIPIDGEEDEKDSSHHNEIINNSQNNIITQNNNNNINNINNITNQQINVNKWVVFSSLNTQKSTRSMATSSKMYMCEFLKHNWKLKAKRLLVKLKKKYSKKIINENSNITTDKIIMNQNSDSKSESGSNIE